MTKNKNLNKLLSCDLCHKNFRQTGILHVREKITEFTEILYNGRSWIWGDPEADEGDGNRYECLKCHTTLNEDQEHYFIMNA